MAIPGDVIEQRRQAVRELKEMAEVTIKTGKKGVYALIEIDGLKGIVREKEGVITNEGINQKIGDMILKYLGPVSHQL